MNDNITKEELINENIILKDKIDNLEKEITELKEHLKKYTAPIRRKKYYENHKEELLQKNKEYIKKTDYYKNHKNTVLPEKRQEYNRKAYLKRKEKENNINNETDNS